MPPSLPLFSLLPYPRWSERAKDVIAHPSNKHLVSTTSNGTLALGIGFHIRSREPQTLATLGRGVDADILVEGHSIARIQCSFDMNPATGVVMFYDRSHSCTSQVFGDIATPFEHGRVRRVLVQQGLNTIIGIGGERRNLIQFELDWHQNAEQTAAVIKQYETLPPCGRVENPRLARTVDEAPTELPSRRETRIHTPGLVQLQMRYLKIHEIGSGQFGRVHKAIDIDSGDVMAVKILRRPAELSKQADWATSLHYALKREVETLAKIDHPYIVNYIASQGWDAPQVEIFMGLKDGSLESLVTSGADTSKITTAVFPQMLQALDCITCMGIIHRDVKPENILYVSQPDGQYQFQLGDFGLCNRAVNATSHAGSELCMAPEMFSGGVQTSKLDVWSLFVTISWILDVEGIRQRWSQFRAIPEIQAAVVAASKTDTLQEIQAMAIINPEYRATAAQMLVKCYNGVGLSTPRNQVPALATLPPPPLTIAAARIPRTTRATQLQQRGVHMNGNIFAAAAAQHRVRRSRGPIQANPLRGRQGISLKPPG